MLPDFRKPETLSKKGVYDKEFFDDFFRGKKLAREQRINFKSRVISAGYFYLNMQESNAEIITDGEQNSLLKKVSNKCLDLENALLELSKSHIATAKLYEAITKKSSENVNLIETHLAKSLLVSRDSQAAYDSDTISKFIQTLNKCSNDAQKLNLGREGGKIGAILDSWLINMQSIWSDFLPNVPFTLGEYYKEQKTYKNADILIDLEKIIIRIDASITKKEIKRSFERNKF